MEGNPRKGASVNPCDNTDATRGACLATSPRFYRVPEQVDFGDVERCP